MISLIYDSCQNNLFDFMPVRKYLFPGYTGHKSNVHKAFRRRPRRLLIVLCTFSLRPVSVGLVKTRIDQSTELECRSINGFLKGFYWNNLWNRVCFNCKWISYHIWLIIITMIITFKKDYSRYGSDLIFCVNESIPRMQVIT